MTAPRRLERPYRVRFDEAGPDGNLRASGYLRFAQDLAWLHSESAGFGRDWYEDHGLTWLVRAIELDIEADVGNGIELTVSTQVIGFRRVWARRRSEFLLPGTGRPLAVAFTDWVLLNERGRPVRPPVGFLDAFEADATPFKPMRVDLSEPVDTASNTEFLPRRSELDPMGHVNNAAYVDYLDELFAAGTSPGLPLAMPRRYQGEFIASAEPGATLRGYGWTAGGTWHYRLEDAGGRALFRATLDCDPGTTMDSGRNI
jgi:acyl-ACP thioesterase